VDSQEMESCIVDASAASKNVEEMKKRKKNLNKHFSLLLVLPLCFWVQ